MGGFRDYYDKDLNFFIEKYKNHSSNEYWILKYAKGDLRMYANLFNRDMRKILLNEYSLCCICKSNHKLTIDHKIPISKGGKNIVENIQILCNVCNMKKGNRLNNDK